MNNLYAQGSNDKRETATLPIPSESCVGWLCFFTFLQPVMSHFHKRGEVQHLACTEQNPVSRNIKWNHTNEVSETQSEQNPQQALAQTGVLQRAVITRLPSHLRSWGKSLLVKALHHDSGDPNLIIFFFFFYCTLPHVTEFTALDFFSTSCFCLFLGEGTAPTLHV